MVCNHEIATCFQRLFLHAGGVHRAQARASSFIPEGEAEHRRKSTFRIGNIWIITSVRHTPSGQQRYFIEIVNRYRGLAVASRHVGILYAVTTPVSSVIFPGRHRRRRFLSSQISRLAGEITFSCGLFDQMEPSFNFTVNEIVLHRLWNGTLKYKILFFFFIFTILNHNFNVVIFNFNFNFQRKLAETLGQVQRVISFFASIFLIGGMNIILN